MAVGVHSWSTSAGDNASADANINWAEGQLGPTLNNSARAQMAATRALLNTIGGAATYGGSSNAYTITNDSAGAWASLAAPRLVMLKANHTNTGAATLAVDGLSATAIKKHGSAALAAGDIQSGGLYLLCYDGTSFQVIGSVGAFASYQAADALLTAIAALTTTADRFLKFTGSDTVAVFDLFGTENTWAKQAITTPSLGSTAGDEQVFATLTAADSNITKLILRSLRVANGSTHDTSALELRRRVDITDHGFQRYGSTGLSWGYGSTPHLELSMSGELTTYDVGPTSVRAVGEKGSEIQNHTTDYTLVLSDAGKTMRAASGTPTWTIPANASVAYPIGTVIPFTVKSGATVMLAITSDTLTWETSTGTRTLTGPARGGVQKVAATEWEVFGSGIS